MADISTFNVDNNTFSFSDEFIEKYGEPVPYGDGYIVECGSGAIVIPPNSQSSDTIALLVPGQAGTNADGGYKPGQGTVLYNDDKSGPQILTNVKENNEWPPYPVVIAKDDLNYDSKNPIAKDASGLDMLDDTYNTLTANGSNITNVGGMGHSNGAYGCMRAVNNFLERHSDKKFDTKLYLTDPYNVENVFKADSFYQMGHNMSELSSNNGESLDALRGDNVEITFTCTTSNNNRNRVILTVMAMALQGYNTNINSYENVDHNFAVYDFFSSGFGWDYLSGNFNTLKSKFDSYIQLVNQFADTILSASDATAETERELASQAENL